MDHLNNNKKAGTYVCAGCKSPHASEHKYDSGSGWPSFDRGVDKNLEYDVDYKIGYARTELNVRFVVDTLDICLTMVHAQRPEKDTALTQLHWPLSLLKMSKYPVEKSEENWKQNSRQRNTASFDKREQNIPLPENTTIILNRAPTAAKVVAPRSTLHSAKFDSGCGWPSYDRSIEGAIEYHQDNSMGMRRVEILCANCGGHQGHIFDDGPTKTGQRYCVNSASIDFKADKEE